VETVLCTLKNDPYVGGIDVEFPANIPLMELLSGILNSVSLFSTSTLVRRDPTLPFVIQVKQGVLPFIRLSHESTLEQVGIFDGAILLVESGTQPVFSDIKCRPPKESAPCLQDIVYCKTFVCRQNRNLIGRDKQAGNPIDVDLKSLMPSANMVSRKHALIFQNESRQWFIHDEGSANGTLLNGRLLTKEQPERLYNKSQIQFGRLGPVLIFYLPEK